MTHKFTIQQQEIQMASMRKRISEENTMKLAMCEASLKDCEYSKIRLLQQIVTLKQIIQKLSEKKNINPNELSNIINSQNEEKIVKLKTEISLLKQELEDIKQFISDDFSVDNQIKKLKEENLKLKEEIKTHHENEKLLEECKQLSQQTDSAEELYDRIDKLETENEKLRLKLEQSKSNPQLLDNTQLIKLNTMGISLSPHEIYIALKFRCRQLDDENRELRGYSNEEDGEDEDEKSYSYSDYSDDENQDDDDDDTKLLKKLRKNVDDLQSNNVELRGGQSPPRASIPTFITNFDNVVTQIQVLKEKNAQLKHDHMKQVKDMDAFPAFMKSAGDIYEQKGDVPQELISKLQIALRDLISEVYGSEENELTEITILRNKVDQLIAKIRALSTQKGCEQIACQNLALMEENSKLKEQLNETYHRVLPLSDPYQL